MIELREISKSFRQNTAGAGLLKALFGRVPTREVAALSGLSFTVEEGQFYSLLGRNGAGKTTAIKILCTLLLADSGTAKVAGNDVVRQAVAVRRSIGVSIRGERSVYWRLTGRQNLEYFGRLYDLTGRELVRRAAEVGEVVGLSDRLDDYVERYSMGMKQRLAIACALIHRPPVLMLDEPTIGLDAAGARALRRFIRKELMQREKVTILYTTHYIHEAEEMSDAVGVLHQGKIVAEGSPAAVARRATSEVGAQLEAKGVLAEGIDLLRKLPGIQTVSLTPKSSGTYNVRLTTDGRELPTAEIVSVIVSQGCELLSLEAVRPSLEDAFVALTGGEEIPANSSGDSA